MADVKSDSPGELGRRCVAKTRHGHPCSAPPLAGKHVCFFHDEDAATSAARELARGKGLRRQRVLAPIGELPPLVFEKKEQVVTFKTELLRRMLCKAIEPNVAKVAGDLAKDIFADSTADTAKAEWDALAKSIEAKLGGQPDLGNGTTT